MKKRNIQAGVEAVKKSAKMKPIARKKPISWRKTVGTGSTLLDLALSGGRCEVGGLPGGILVEIYGKSSAGKSSILAEIAGCTQADGGEVVFLDPEARFDKEYARIYGVELDKSNYHKPDTVTEVFDILANHFTPPDNDKIHTIATDSLAALSTNLEMEKGDAMGMRRAKEFSEGLRKYCRLLEKKNWVLACSNQIRQSQYGDRPPGGNAVEFYSSARISIRPVGKIERSRTLTGGKKVTKIIGIESECTVTKSSIDDPWRKATIYIVFGYGIDDVRANLQYIKDHGHTVNDAGKASKLTKYRAIDKEYQVLEQAIAHIEKNDLIDVLKKEVITLWNEVESAFVVERKRKKR